ncbi:ABC transporter substrate-binding protein [Halomarina halobia]|uniref:ABC transporter substrate-binding protein n=1 Tax=Halomarina halobia TaxID=3033386 RepID=A0ABD6AER1_9EURY|nr:ABC transporter substrate-binding protein [Halomarina sp. PSR21]
MTDRSRRSFLRRGSAALGTAALGGIAGCMDNVGLGGASGSVKLGAINPLSGPASFFGELATETQSAWAERVNEGGGIQVGDEQRQVDIVEYDDQSQNSEARSAAQRLVTADGVSAILSSWRSTGAIAISSIVNENQVPTFTHGFTPEVNTPDTYVLRLTVSTIMDAYPALTYISESNDIENIGVIAEEGDWGDDTLDLMRWWFRESDHAGDFKNLGRFSFDQQDFSSFITRIKRELNNGNIDALYVQTWASAMERFLIQANRNNLNEALPIFTGLGGADYNNIGNVGAGMANVHALGLYTRLDYRDVPAIEETLSQESLDQFDAYRELGAPEHPTAYNVYADAQATQFALEQAGSTDGQALRDALVGNELTTILGTVSMNDRGQPAIPGALIRFGADGDSATVDEVVWADQIPPLTSIPPEEDI